MTSAIATVARMTAAASLRSDHRARGRYRPFTRQDRDPASLRRAARNATGWGTIWRHHTAQSAPNRHADSRTSRPDGDQRVGGHQQRAEPKGVATNHLAASMRWVVRAGNGTDEEWRMALQSRSTSDIPAP